MLEERQFVKKNALPNLWKYAVCRYLILLQLQIFGENVEEIQQLITHVKDERKKTKVMSKDDEMKKLRKKVERAELDNRFWWQTVRDNNI